ncbi:hypothetical protein [Klenkia soli]|uniref:hypothetical protein n=1 Tax=Klenkia soli TaxID=1052260 RepID=UPI001041DCAF|nr:hypothetical protein [Klenkia soli]
MRALAVTLGVLLSLAAAVFAAAAIALFVDGDGGAGGFATFVTLVSLLCAVLLFRASPRRGAPRRRPERRADSGFYYGDSTPSYGYAAGTPVTDDRRWGGDGGADTGTAHHGHGHSDGGGWSGSDGGSSGGSDGGGGGGD